MKKPTIYENLKTILNREPTYDELKKEVIRIINEALIDIKSNVKTKKRN